MTKEKIKLEDCCASGVRILSGKGFSDRKSAKVVEKIKLRIFHYIPNNKT